MLLKKVLSCLNRNKAASLDQILKKFQKKAADMLVCTSLAEMINLSVKLYVPPEECKTDTLKSQFQKGSKTNFCCACSVQNSSENHILVRRLLLNMVFFTNINQVL